MVHKTYLIPAAIGSFEQCFLTHAFLIDIGQSSTFVVFLPLSPNKSEHEFNNAHQIPTLMFCSEYKWRLIGN